MHTTVFLAASVLLAAQPAGERITTSRDYTLLSHCVVSLIGHVELPAQEEGILKELNVEEGELVTDGQVLGTIDDTDVQVAKRAAELKRDIAKEKADSDAEVQVAKKLIEVYRAEYDESIAINKAGRGAVIPVTTVRRQLVQWEKAELDAVVTEMNDKIADLEHKVAQVELETVENELKRRTIKAPFDGVVVQLYHQESEWLQPGEPVLRVVRMDRLRVEGFLNADEYAPEEIQNARVEIRVNLVGRQETFEGKIDYVSPLVEATGDYRVWAEVDNKPGRGGYPWLLRPGSEAEMLIRLR
jgi:macrolide-specific efflux system membrane fusion protein